MNTNQTYFKALAAHLRASIETGTEHFYFYLIGEDTKYIRFSQSKVRQIGDVYEWVAELTFLSQHADGGWCRVLRTVSLSGKREDDLARLDTCLGQVREAVAGLPADPYVRVPAQPTQSEFEGRRSSDSVAPEVIDNAFQGCDAAGILASGLMVRAMCDSVGSFHYFDTASFSIDYSIYNQQQRAVKGLFSGDVFDESKFKHEVARDIANLEIMGRPSVSLNRGKYRVYLSPDAVASLIRMLSWGGVSEYAIQKGESPLRHCRSGERSFSKYFNLEEDFSLGVAPRFNGYGEVAPENLLVFNQGQLHNSLINARSASEFKLVSNGASDAEVLRSPRLRVSPEAPVFAVENTLRKLDTGIYISNLHYLNWSDQKAGRVTGLTRFACFTVESGQAKAPIETMRFDINLFDVFGTDLEAFTDSGVLLTETGTYDYRQLGGSYAHGAIVNNFHFTL